MCKGKGILDFYDASETGGGHEYYDPFDGLVNAFYIFICLINILESGQYSQRSTLILVKSLNIAYYLQGCNYFAVFVIYVNYTSR